MKLLRAFLVTVLFGTALSIALYSASAQGRRGGGQGGPPGGGQFGGEGGPERPSDPMSTPTFGGLRFRSIGPSVVGGRVNGFAVDPNDRAKFFIAVASGGVWKTANAGTTWTPVFDNYGSFSIGAIALDQKDTSIVWVGTNPNTLARSPLIRATARSCTSPRKVRCGQRAEIADFTKPQTAEKPGKLCFRSVKTLA